MSVSYAKNQWACNYNDKTLTTMTLQTYCVTNSARVAVDNDNDREEEEGKREREMAGEGKVGKQGALLR